MNRMYRLVWRESIGGYVAVSETAKGRGKRASSVVGAVVAVGLAVAAEVAAAGPPGAHELPTGGAVAAGQAQIGQAGSRMDVIQGSSRAIINWQTFNIGSQAQVNFRQPDASSVALNRVQSADPSSIFGKLTANGQVMLVNPNGIVFGAGSRVDVGGLAATTLNIADGDFMAGRFKFTRGDALGSVVNQGTLTAAEAGYIALLAPEVRNEGIVSARLGTVALAAGDAVTLDISGRGMLGVKVNPASVNALVENRAIVQADGGTVIMSAGAASRLLEQAVAGSNGASQMVSENGRTRLVSSSGTVSASGGAVKIEGSMVDVAGLVDAGGAMAGRIDLNADFLSQSGSLRADASQGRGGQVKVDAGTAIQTASALMSANGALGGGTVRLDGHERVYSSATLQAKGTAGSAQGGAITAVAKSVQLRAATLDASGAGAGGQVRVGGGFHGLDTDIVNATEVGINGTTVLRADAGQRGDGGSVAVWSDGTTTFGGQVSAKGGAWSGNGGLAEVSGKESLAFAGRVNLSAAHGRNGQLLLDPRNIIIDDAASAIASLSLSNPGGGSNTDGFGTVSKVLGNNQVAITAPNADTGATLGTGAVYLFNSATGALLSDLRGSNAGDHVGSGGIYTLANGNYLVLSPSYGTVTGKDYFSRLTNDGADGIYSIKNGAVSAGAITWQSGSGSNGGASSLVSASNSLVGSTANTDTKTYYTYSGTTLTTSGSKTVTANDRLGQVDQYDINYNELYPTTSIFQLTDGNLAIATPYWNNGRGAVTWMNAGTGALSTGAAGAAVSASTSLVGSTAFRSQANVETDSASKSVYVIGLGQSTYRVYNSTNSTSARTTSVGGAGDFVGKDLTVLPNGQYAVQSPNWTNSATDYAGAVTFAATGGVTGAVSASNSLVGTHKYDFVGSGGVLTVGAALSNYVVMSPYWTATGNASAGRYFNNTANGAVTWIDGSTGFAFGDSALGAAVSSSNSFTGAAGDFIGSFNSAGSSPYTSYTNSPYTIVSATDTRYSSGSVGVQVLKNGNYLIADKTSGANKGSVTFAQGGTGIAGTLSSSNSLVGGTAGDYVGATITELADSNYVVAQPTWTNPTGSKTSAGAVTWGSGSSGVTGTVSAANSLVGTDSYEQVGLGGVLRVGATGANGLMTDYLVLSPEWGNRSGAQYLTTAFGAVTWVSGGNGQAFGAGSAGAAVSSSNSLVGSTGGDYVGSQHTSDTRSNGYIGTANYQVYSTWYAQLTATVDVLANGDYLVRSPNWSAGKGAATWGNGGTGVAGTISSSNSLVGSTSDVYSTSSVSNQVRGGHNYTDTTTYLTTTGDHVGLLGQALPNGSYLLISPSWGNGRGAITWLAGSAHTGTVSASNSLVGSTQDVFSDVNHSTLVSAGDRLGTLADANWSTPVISDYTANGNSYTASTVRPVGPYQLSYSFNGLDGSNVYLGKVYSVQAARNTELVSDGYGGVNTRFAYNASPIAQVLANGNVLVASSSWNNTGAAAAGAVTWFNASNGHLADGSSGGTLSASNSLVGSHANDHLGMWLPVGGAVGLVGGDFVLVNPQWFDERGAITWGSDTAGVTGTVSSSNSLVGSTGSSTISTIISGVYVPASGTYNPTRYANGIGYINDWVIDQSNGRGDQVGLGGVFALADGNVAIASPFWNSSSTYAGTGVPTSYGAVTWFNGANGHLIDGSAGGSIAAANSLVGSQHGDAVGFQSLVISNVSYLMPGVTTLTGGRYVVASPYWSNGATTGVGAVTFNEAGGTAGAVGSANSLVGSTAGDHVGRGFGNYNSFTYGYDMLPAVMVLSNGSYTNYLVRSSDWTNTTDAATGGAGAGAFTWVNGLTGAAYGESGKAATVSMHNSLVGNVAGDGVGTLGEAMTRLVSGNAVATGDALLLSNAADCLPSLGAITLMPGATGLAGPVSWRNSLFNLAPVSAGLDTSTPDGLGNFLSDIHYSILTTSVTGAETVQYRPFVWVAPNYTSGNNAMGAAVLTVVGESTAASTTASSVNTGGNANWESSLFAGNGSNFTAVGGNAGTGLLGFASNTGADLVLTPAMLASLLNAGTNVTLQANNDITVLKDIVVSAGGQGGDLSLEAGRSVKLFANVTTDNGAFSAKANQTVAHGVVDSDCSTCVAQLTMLLGTTIDAGTGSVLLSILDSTDKTTNTAARMQVGNLLGGSITLSNGAVDANGNGVGVGFNAGATIGSAGTHALTLLGRGGSNHSGGILMPSDVVLTSASDATLTVGAADPTWTTSFGGSGTDFFMSASEMGAIIQQSQGFGSIVFGRSDQVGQTTLASVDFTAANMLRTGSSTLDANLKIQGGSGGLNLTGTVKSGEAAGRTFELASTGGTVALGASSSVTAATGILKLSANGGGSVTQTSGSVLNASQLLLAGNGTQTLSTGTNTIGTLAGNVGAANVRTTSGHLTIGTVGGVDGLTGTAGVTLQASGANSDVVLNKAVANGSGTMTLAAGRNFVNNNAADTGLVPGSGRYLVYSSNPTNSTEGMSTYGKHYNQTYSAGVTPAYASSGNWFLYSVAPALTASVSGGSSTVVYGSSPSLSGVNLTGFIDGDSAGTATTGSLDSSVSSYTPTTAGYMPVGTYSVSLNGVGTLASALGYQISVTPGSSSVTVQAKALNASGLSADNKVYDGTRTAALSGTATLVGGGSASGDGRYLAGDVVSISGSATGLFSDKDQGTGKSVALSGLSLSGADAANYTISANSVTADITRKALNITGLSVASNKVYDGTTTAVANGTAALLVSETAGTGSSTDGKRYTGDVVSLSGTASGSYNSKDVASATTVSFGGLTLTGADADNYTLVAGSASSTITAKALSVSGLSAASSKVYDGTTTAVANGTAALLASETAGSGNTSDGKRYTGDVVSLSGTASGSYNSKDVASATTVNFGGLSLTGADAGNYTLSAGSASASITAKTLSLSGLSVASSKVYDGTTLAVVNGAAALLASETAGSGNSADGRRYTGDTVLLSGTASGSYNSKDVASATTVSFGGLSLTGADASNYTLSAGNASGSITAKALSLSGLSVASSKVYDGTATAVVNGTAALLGSETAGSGNSADGQRYTGDTVALSGTASGSYNSKDVASATTVSFGGLSLTGADASNYSLSIGSASATITAKSLSVSGLSANSSKVYDGTTQATVNGTAVLLASETAGSGSSADGKRYTGDTVSLSGTASGTYDSKDVASATTVSFGGLSLSGADAGNYTLSAGSTSSTITAKALSVGDLSVAASKVYDGTTMATVHGVAALLTSESAGSGSGTDGKRYTGDAVALSGTASGSYNSKDVASATTVSFGGLSLSGADASNYTLNSGSAASTITAKALSVSGLSVAATKVYDGTTLAAVNGTATLLASETAGSGNGADGQRYTGDTVSLSGTASGSYNSKDVASASSVSVGGLSLSGSDAGNYTLTPVSQTASITAKSLSLQGLSVGNKTYDGTTTAVVSGTASLVGNGSGSSDGQVITGDAVSLSGTASAQFLDGHAGVNKSIVMTGLSLSGSEAGNYALAPLVTTASIAARAITVAADNQTKVYGAADPTLSFQVGGAGLTGNDTLGQVITGALSTATGAGATAGHHAITQGTLTTNSDYTVSAFTQGDLLVTKAALTITADDKAKVYGQSDPTLSYVVNTAQLKYGDTASVLTAPVLQTATGANATAGDHAITATGASADNYEVTAIDGTLHVSKASLSVTAEDRTKVYGDADPALTYHVNTAQLKYNDTASVVSGVALSTATGASATAGDHVITAAQGSAANYDLVLADGNLHVTKAALTVMADDKAKVYGDVDPALTYSAQASQLKYTDTVDVVSGLALSATTGASATAGQHVISIEGGTAANYEVSTQNGTLAVDKAPLTVTADSKAKTAGEADPALSYTVSTDQLRYGDAATVVHGVQLAIQSTGPAPGTQAIHASQGQADNYLIDHVDGVLVIKPSPSVKAENLINISNPVNTATGQAGTGTSVREAPAAPVPVTANASGTTPGGVVNAPPGKLTVVNGGVSFANAGAVSSATAPNEAGAGGAAFSGNGGNAGTNPGTNPSSGSSANGDAANTAATHNGTGSAATGGNTRSADTMAISPSGRLVSVREDVSVKVAPGQPLVIPVAGAFQRPESAQVSFTATQKDGSALPAWLKVDAATGALTGNPPAGEARVIDVVVVAHGDNGDSASTQVKIDLVKE